MHLMLIIFSFLIVSFSLLANEQLSEECDVNTLNESLNSLISDTHAITNKASKCTPEQIILHKKNMLKIYGPVDMTTCLPKQKTIIGNHSYQLKVQINKLLKGISYEISKGTDPGIIKAYKKLLTELVARSAYTTDLWHQISKVDPKNMCAPFVFQENPVGEASFQEALNKANEIAEEKEFSIAVTEKLKEDLVNDTFKITKEETIKLAKQSVSNNALKTVLKISASGIAREIVAGAVKGVVVDLLMKPLYGAKVPEYSEWKDAMTEDVSLLLNPQWMDEAGISISAPSYQWVTHCRALDKYKDQMTKLNLSFTMEPSRNFEKKVLNIIKQADLKKKGEIKKKYDVEVSESTYVIKQETPAESEIPFWAK